MSELIPVAQAAALRDTLSEYLGTTFSLADPETRAALEDFLTDRDHGMFRGPYVRLRLPFRPADDGWRDALEWYEGLPPYGHQAEAFARLSSANLTPERPRSQPTLVTTGTGSGKTEAFLYPILDHVLRARRRGIRGTKAIVLYPMNALANDQAKRLTEILSSRTELADITAALYTGQDDTKRTKVSADGLITAREIIRDEPPDILLTNYKMLDQLLLREKDAKIWSESARSLQYLVLDEFHTYDGAQGTDVSMLLRRLGLALKAYWSDSDPSITDEDRQRPLGQVTPVATSATLGDKGDPSSMLEFARTVFGEDFGPDAVVTESRLTVDDWAGGARERLAGRGWEPVDVDTLTFRGVPDEAAPAQTTLAVLGAMYRTADGSPVELAGSGDENHELLLDMARAHPFVRALVDASADAVDLTELARGVVPRGAATTRAQSRVSRRRALGLVLTALSHVRAVAGRAALSVDVHLWVRELTRLDRAATGSPHFSWGDDGVLPAGVETVDGATSTVLPAIYCRHCHRSGWGVVLAPTGSDLDTSDKDVRRRHLGRDDKFRPLLHAPEEARRAQDEGAPPDENLLWFLVDERRFVSKRPSDAELGAGTVLPVLTHRGENAGEASVDDVCPSCLQRDGIRFLGSAIATLLSVNLSGLFGTQGLDEREKKALVFTDSVQDAAHRAGFVQARSHSLTLRSVLRQAIGDDPVSLEQLVLDVVQAAGDDANHRYRLLPPDLAEREKFAPFWQAKTVAKVPNKVRARVQKRLGLDVLLEFGLRSGVGRTLETTGSVVAGIDAAASVLAQAAQEALDEAGGSGTLDAFEPTRGDLIAWARGVLERMRTQGAIDHEWFSKFRHEDGNRWWLTGGRRRQDGMPGFGRGSSAPSYPRIGGAAAAKDSDMDPIATPRGWYAQWTARTLGVDASDGAVLVRHLFRRLENRDVIGSATSGSGATTYHLLPEAIVVRAAELEDLEGGRLALVCGTCHDITPALPEAVDQLEGAPCLVSRCTGTLERHQERDNFYRRMYASSDVRRVVAREHTSLLDDAVRLAYEKEFKSSNPAPNAPNVLVATPTLEMGIDIGDLSAVILSSLPRTVASYLQRVGRAGRLTGNSLALAFVTARGDQLPRFADPLGTINGAVRPPATYLQAEEILRRQYLASIADVIARRPDAPHPQKATEALASTDVDTYLGALIAEAESHGVAHLAQFLGSFDVLDGAVADRLRGWATADDGTPGTSGLARRCHDASQSWRGRVEELEFRRGAIEGSIPELQQKAVSPAATRDDERDVRTALAALALTRRQLAGLRGEYWISVLEEFGLLPNYTLLDDSVSLDVALSWVDPDTQEYKNEPLTFERGSSNALREFAPGNTFYASGYAIEIDAVELGHDNEAVRTWAFCPACGYGADIEETGGSAGGSALICPRCGSSAIADVRQRLDVVELKAVSSAIRREEASIDDRRDERERTSYDIVTLADVDPARVTRRWYVEGYGFGAKHVRDMTLRWLNLGPRGTKGSTLTLGGGDVDASLFRLCDRCGKRDTSTGKNSPNEHRPWCPRRKALAEHSLTVALSRTLRTEGLLMRLPTSVTLGDHFALPSLQAAVLLALRERIGGAPDHLAVATVVDPTPGEESPEALLLHDIVPGGTGYLAELADEAVVWGMLRATWLLLRACPCQHEGRLACDRCLLPFAAPFDVDKVSRAAAERHLRAILLGGEDSNDVDVEVPEAIAWTVTADEPPAPDPESQLEQKFRQVLRGRLTTLGATIVEQPTSSGNSWQITFGGGARWRLEPQQYVQGSRPDFVLTSARPDIPPVAIFTDGLKYHAMPSVNRVADDAAKREILRDGGYQVVAVTWKDLDGAETAAPPADPSWLAPGASEEVLLSAGDGLQRAALDLVRVSGLEKVIAWIQWHDVTARERLAHWLPALVLRAAMGAFGAGTSEPTDALEQIALGVLDGSGAPSGGSVPTFVWRRDTLGLAVRVVDPATMTCEIAVVLDDDETALGEGHGDAWRSWLELANILNHRTAVTTITTRHRIASGAVSTGRPAVSAGVAKASVGLNDDWALALEQSIGVERELVLALSALADAGIAAPTLGEEVGEDAIPLTLAWPLHRVTVLTDDLTEEDREGLAAAGWTLVEADLDSLRSALLEGNPA